MQREPEPGRLVPLALRGRRGLPERRRHDPDRLRRQHPVEALGDQPVAHRRPAAQLRGEHVRRDPLGPATVPGPALGRRGVERDGDAGHPVGPGQHAPLRASGRVQPERVDDGGQAAPDPHPHHLVQQRERVGARGDVVLAGADHRPELVAGDDRVRREMRGRPGGLARRTGPDEHDQTGRREVDWLGHRVSPRPGLRREFPARWSC